MRWVPSTGPGNDIDRFLPLLGVWALAVGFGRFVVRAEENRLEIASVSLQRMCQPLHAQTAARRAGQIRFKCRASLRRLPIA